MQKFKFISFLLVLIVSSSVLAGCTLFTPNASAMDVYNKYNLIVTDYTLASAEDSFFDGNGNIFITYNQNSALIGEIDKEGSMFDKINDEYEAILYSALEFFNEFSFTLTIASNDWDRDKTSKMYSNLLEFEEALEEFEVYKKTLEGRTIVEISATPEIDYDIIIVRAYEEFIKVYNDLLLKTINFAKSFESAYMEDIINLPDYEGLTVMPINDVKRLTSSAQLDFAEASYYYYMLHLEDFDYKQELGVTELQWDTLVSDGENPISNTLYFKLDKITDDIQTRKNLDWSMNDSSETVLEFYKDVREREAYVNSQMDFYVKAITEINKLDEESPYYDTYLAGIETMTNYIKNYANFTDTLISYY
jgi:hypothetical protein